jgi:transposase
MKATTDSLAPLHLKTTARCPSRGIRHHSGEGLDTWLRDVRASSVREFLLFAQSRERDKAAILAGLTLPYSTGPVEGHINRLKLIKRKAYGRAELSYLQHRFLPVA